MILLYIYRDRLDSQAKQDQKDNKDFPEWKVFQDQKERKGIRAHRAREVSREIG
jgi:hypothetical protein